MHQPSDSTRVVLEMLDAAHHLNHRLDGALGTLSGITFSEFRLLEAVDQAPRGATTRVQLAEAVRLSPSGVTRALKPLEKLGFVATQRSERDARQARAVLTDEGTELLRNAAGIVDDTVADLVSAAGIADADLAPLRALISQLRV